MKKLQLGHFPTPIEVFPALPAGTGVGLYIKRDDYSGTEVSGNKIRKLEYCLAEALELGADTIVTTGAVQSNHCRATAAAAARLSLSCHLILRGKEFTETEGNLFLDLALGATVQLMPEAADRDEFIGSYLEDLKKLGRNPYFIPIGASNAVGSLGYRDCFDEILEQEKSMDVRFDAIALAVGSGGTYAGLWYGNEIMKAEKEILGFSVSDSSEQFSEEIYSILKDMYEQSGMTYMGEVPEFYLNDGYIGEGYAKSTREELDFILQIARKTSVLFDPCYTGKAFRGLYSEIVSGRLDHLKRILFIHTGGLMGWTKENRTEALDVIKK